MKKKKIIKKNIKGRKSFQQYKNKKTLYKLYYFKIGVIMFMILIGILMSLIYKKPKNQKIKKQKYAASDIYITYHLSPKIETETIEYNPPTIQEQIDKLKSNEKYFACFCSLAKNENLYAKQLLDYYIKLGFHKFIFGDNNIPDTEKLSDVLQEYINATKVDIIDIMGSSIGQSEFFYYVYNNYKDRCEWFGFFDFDEYLEMHNEQGKSIDVKEYLSNSKFDKCESVAINWLIYTDNNLLHYDDRPLIERFTEPNYNDDMNKLVKSMVRGKLDKIPFVANKPIHRPESIIKECDSDGNILSKYDRFELGPKFDHAFIKHFNTKTAGEFVDKINRGDLRNKDYVPEERVTWFFTHNKFSEEKLKIFENAFNLSLSRNSKRYKVLYKGN